MTRRATYLNSASVPLGLTDGVSVSSPCSALQAEIIDAFRSWSSASDKNAIEKQMQEWWERYGCKLSSPEFALCFTRAIQQCYPRNNPPSDNLLRLAFECLYSLDALKEENFDEIVKIELCRLQAYYHPDAPGETFRWLRACFNVTAVSALYFQIYGLSREEEMRSIVFDGQGMMRSCFREGELRYYTIRIVNSFLRRYDLSAAFAILRTITLSKSEPDQVIRHGLGRDSWRRSGKVFLLAVSLVSFLLVAAAGWIRDWWPGLTLLIEWMPLRCGGDPWTDAPSMRIWRILLYPVGSGSLLLTGFFFSVWHWRKRRFDNLRRLLPRLLAGILVGYVPLMSAGDPWKWLLQMQLFPTAGFLWLLMLLISLGYLYVEARNTLTEGELSNTMRKELWIRVFHVLFIGLSEALIIGIALSELFGETVILSLLEDLKDPSIIAVTGWIGYVFPKVILLYAPFALFLGILVQLIWDEKTVAQPL